MRKVLLILLLQLAWGVAAHADDAALAEFPQVLLETSEGEIVLELDRRRAPLTVAAFVKLVRAGHYKGTIFHRVDRDFVIQGGGYYRDYSEAPPTKNIPNESGNGLRNELGTVAMARTEDPHSADAQFYINLDDNFRLDPRPDRWGYTVFGRVFEGLDVVDQIASIPVGPAGPFSENVPTLPIVIKSARVLTQEEISARAEAALEAAKRELEALE